MYDVMGGEIFNDSVAVLPKKSQARSQARLKLPLLTHRTRIFQTDRQTKLYSLKTCNMTYEETHINTYSEGEISKYVHTRIGQS